jgi:phosphate:Na+ symporter
MHYMGQAVEPLQTVGAFKFLIKASLSNPWFGLVVGTLFTAVVQSSVGTLTILLALPASFHVAGGWQPGIGNYLPLIIGANFGTCVTALFATINARLEGVRVAWAHCLFKAIGVLLVFPFVSLLPRILPSVGIPMEMQIANAHTLFNVFLSAVCLPFLSGFAALVQRSVAAKTSDGPTYRVQYISDEALSIPIVAISQSVKEISWMSDRVMHMVENAYLLISQHTAVNAASIAKQDDEVDFLHESIVKYCTSLSQKDLSQEESAKAYELIMVTTDLEHIGDVVSQNIITLAEKIHASPYPLSNEGKEEILEFFAKTIERLKMTIAAFTLNDKNLALTVYNGKGVFNAEYESYYSRHLERLYRRKIESLQTTSIHIDLLEEISRINYFTFRIAAHLLGIFKAD